MNLASIFYHSRVAIIKTFSVLLFLTSCGSDEETKTVLQVTAISPTSGPANITVTITGTDFSTVLAENKVTFNGKDAVVTMATATQLTTTVPSSADTGPVIVSVMGKSAANKPIFTVEIASPEVTQISPTSGPITTPVIITGANFSTVLAENIVTFNGKEAIVSAATAIQLTVTVPLLAATGPIVVKVKDKTAANQPNFTVEPPTPEVDNISPTSGLTNTPVVITGANFSTVLSENKVTFNGKDAIVSLATATELTVTVPLLAEKGPVVVTVKGKVAVNQPVFTVLVIPVLTTSAISDIVLTNAMGGGNITNEGGSLVSSRGVCWSTSPAPTIANSKTVNGTGGGVFTSSITGLTLGITYYVRAYATNSFGTAYGNEVTFKSPAVIGQSYQGGIIAYVFQPEDPGYVEGEAHGIIAAESDYIAQVRWRLDASQITTGATGTALGTGKTNTIKIVGTLGSQYPAAGACFNYSTGIYEDWYLPSKDELNKLYLARNVIGGFTIGYYWSSTEDGYSTAKIQSFSTSIQSSYDKQGLFYARPIRYF